MEKMKRRPKMKELTIYLPLQLVEALEQEHQRTGISKSDIIRTAIAFYLLQDRKE